MAKFSKTNILLLCVAGQSAHIEKQFYEIPEFVRFQTIVIMNPNWMTFDRCCVRVLCVTLVRPFEFDLNLVHL